jgi:hypothetical protein
VLPLLWLTVQGVIHRGRHHDALDDTDLLLFTEVSGHDPAEASAAATLVAERPAASG